jgi:hypothetical protein
MKCTSRELYFNVLLTWPDQIPSAPALQREQLPDDPSLTAFLNQIRREVRHNGS